MHLLVVIVSVHLQEGEDNCIENDEKNENFVQLSTEYGQALNISESDISLLKEFLCHSYGGDKLRVSNVSELQQYLLFCVKGAEISSHMLPPSRQSLRKHILRGNYQAYIWRESLTRMRDMPGPDCYGWKTNKRELSIDWSNGKAAPDCVIEMMSCKC